MSAPAIAFIDLKAQRDRIRERIDAAIAGVIDRGAFILGPEVQELEEKLGAFCGAKHVITCANGTDALTLVLMANGVKPGEAIFVPAFTFVATAEAVAGLGATPVFVDVDETSFNMAPKSLDDAIGNAERAGLKPVGVIPVGLFGQPADYDVIEQVAAQRGLWILDDAAQSFGATYKGRSVGTFGLATATSFFPAKPLGCYGDGGAVMTADDELAGVIRSLRVHGQGRHKYENIRVGMNGRLDTLQAAILIEKLTIFADEIATRQRVATRYTRHLGNIVQVPLVSDHATSVWAQYTIRVPAARRDILAAELKQRGIPTAIYYPIPLNRQRGYAHYPVAPHGVPVSEQMASEVLSLPMHPYLTTDTQDIVIDAVRGAVCSA